MITTRPGCRSAGSRSGLAGPPGARLTLSATVCGYSFGRVVGVPPTWESSAFKHSDVQRFEAVYAMVHATYASYIEDEESGREGRVRLFIGPRHGQTAEEIEILVREFPDSSRPAAIFHVMRLGTKFRRYREEHPGS